MHKNALKKPKISINDVTIETKYFPNNILHKFFFIH